MSVCHASYCWIHPPVSYLHYPLFCTVSHSLSLLCSREESKVLPIAIPVLLSIGPDTHLAIRSITLRLVGQLSEWIDKHPDTLDQVLKFILDGLHIPAVASEAAKAVHSVCQKCKERMAPHFEGLLQVIANSHSVPQGMTHHVSRILTLVRYVYMYSDHPGSGQLEYIE